ncbi:hypothetical protein Q4Q39_03145 [Flavivirga amylovorans]|uniref:Glycosyltransferase RgtA/B/C/D-like domain-containing protein n=1 Tax=Flavivirga amylovorans TaxID=870486 RepID=A0ABT8WY16_9FLAO|nr:hypothetical protein [Flavivirga amylovorans]MDO5986392.1 hypothetical protein [Flavivirga amylovorans]
MDRLEYAFKRIFIVGILFYVVCTAIYIINIPVGRGDEQLFINDLSLIDTDGWLVAIKKSISIPYMLLAYPLTLVFKKHIALRLVSLLVTIMVGIYFWKRNKPSFFFFAAILFYLCTTIFFFYGTNDALYSMSLIIFFNEVFQLYKNNTFNSNVAFVALATAFFTRALTIIYFPIILLAFFIIFKHKNKIKLKFLYPLLFVFALLCFNLPSLKEKGTLSYDLKAPPESVNVNWAQRQYLAQLLVNKGDLKKGKHPTWLDTQTYVDINGEESLPKSILESLVFDLSLTINEFFKDVSFATLSSFRQLGFILVLIIFLPLVRLIKKRSIDYNMFIPVSVIIMLFVFSLIIISNVELRWLAPVFMMAFVWYFDLEESRAISRKFITINYLVFIALTFYGGLKMFNKIL